MIRAPRFVPRVVLFALLFLDSGSFAQDGRLRSAEEGYDYAAAVRATPAERRPRFDAEPALLDFVFEHPRPLGYRGYGQGPVDRRARALLPAELPRVTLRIDAAHPGAVHPHVLDEVNIWKGYAILRPNHLLVEKMGPGFLGIIAPWWRWARIPAALGGNYTPEASAACDARERSAAHDLEPGWECGDVRTGGPGLAAWYEPVRLSDDGEVVTDFENLQVCMREAERMGLVPHLNLSSASSVFTGGRTAMKWYHWNEEPVRDLDGWADYVEAALRALGGSACADWRFSIVNEPNCIRGDGGHLYKVGYRGGPLDYARQYAATARAVRRVLPDARFQVGNYVVSDLLPEEKNLHRYLLALANELAEQGMRWEDSTFYSISVYDVPHKSLYGADATKFARFERFREAIGLAPLPLKVDEFDIHADLSGAYDAAHERPYWYTWHAASWMAKALHVFRDHGVRSAAMWTARVFHDRLRVWLPTPRYYAFLFDSLLAGQVEIVGFHEAFPLMKALDPGGADPAYHRLPVTGGVRPTYLGEGYSYRSVDAMASRSANGDRVRIWLYHDTSVLVSDEETAEAPEPAEVGVFVDGLAPGAYEITTFAVGPHLAGNGPADRWVRWDEEQDVTTPFLPLSFRVAKVGAGESLDVRPLGAAQATFAMPKHAMVFVDVRRKPGS